MKFRNSSLAAAEFCPTKFKLQYLDEMPEPGLLSPDLTFGTAIHLAVQFYFMGSDPEEVFETYWKSLDTSKYDWESSRLGYNDLFSRGLELMRKWRDRHAHKYVPLHVEKPLEFKIGDFTFTGKPDFIGYYEDKLVLCDFKTSAASIDKRRPRVDPQMWIYVEAALQCYGIAIPYIMYAPFIKNDARVQNPIIFEVEKNILDEQISNVTIKCIELVKREKSGLWPRNSQNCLRCKFFEHCYGSQQIP